MDFGRCLLCNSENRIIGMGNRFGHINIRKYKIEKRPLCIIFLFSVLFSLFWLVGRKIVFSGFMSAGYEDNYLLDFQVKDCFLFLAGIIGSVVVISTVLHLINKVPLESRKYGFNQFITVFCIITLVLFLFWLPYILSFAPGSVLADSLASVSQAINGYQYMNNHHPVIYTLFVGIFIQIGLELGNINYGVFLYSIVQSGIMSIVIAMLLCRLYKYGISKIVIGAFLLYYAIMPFFPSYAIIMWKDPLFSCGLMLMALFFFEVYQTGGGALHGKGWIICYCISGILCFFRNNGIYVLIVSLVTMFCCYRRQSQRVAIIGVVMVAIYFVANSWIFSILHIEKDYEENVGILLQQIARVVAYDGEMEDSEKEFLFHILPEEKWKERYHPCLVDSIKWDEEFDVKLLEEKKGEFLSVWSSLLKKNLGLYIEAYILDTFGFWTIGTWNGYGYIDIYISDNTYGIKNTDLFEKVTGFSIQEKLKSFVPHIGEGWFIWLMLVSFCLSLCKSTKSMLVYIPLVVNWVTILVATPVAFSLRYVYICALALPLLVAMPLIVKSKEGSSFK